MTQVDSRPSAASGDKPNRHRGRTIAIIVAAVVVVALIVTALVIAGARGAATNAENAGNAQGGSQAAPGATDSPAPPSPSPLPSSGDSGGATDAPKVDKRFGATVSQTVAQDADAKLAGGLTAKIVSIDNTNAKAVRAGETAGTAIKVTISLSNTAGRDVSLSQVSVNAFYGGKSTPAVALTDGAKPLQGSLANGATASGVYLFSIPSDQRDSAVITMTDSAGAPVTVFK
ncbi:hypothetical protein [Leifsonia poae]|uniref:hypothetical protein n=1 Tax=Leifsonia poae TaxID=110933 RepID=UPI003D679415